MQSWIHFNTENQTCNNSIFNNLHGIFDWYFSQVCDSWDGGSNEFGNMTNHQAELRERKNVKHRQQENYSKEHFTNIVLLSTFLFLFTLFCPKITVI